jgi:ribose transport system substrate-binding protein
MKKNKAILTLVGVCATALVVSACSSTSNSSSSAASNKPASATTYTYNSNAAGIDQINGSDLAKTLGQVTATKKYRIAVILKALTNQYWQGIQAGAKGAGDKLGVDVVIQAASGESAQNQQLTIAQTLAGQKFDAYVVAPESASNLNPAIAIMQAQKAPIVNVDDARIAATVYTGPDHQLDGTQAAQYLAKLFPKGGKVAQIEGQAGSSAAILRIKGFKDGVTAAGNLQLIASVPGDWDANKAYAAAQQIIKQHPDLKGIYANNDTMAVGVAKAVKDSGKKIAVVGTDGVPEAIAGVRSGTMAATVSPLPFYEGYWAVEAAVRLLEGQKVATWVVAPAQLITKDNVDQFYNQSGMVLPNLF